MIPEHLHFKIVSPRISPRAWALALTAALFLLRSLGPLAPAFAQTNPAREGLAESIVAVKLERGVELRLLVNQRLGTRPDIAVLLFAGYPGILRLREEGGEAALDMGGNFLMRARRFLNSEQVFTVAVDCPQDQWLDCGDRYRSSAQHAQDVMQAVAAVKTQLGARQVYVAGTSYGTVSTAFLARALGGKRSEPSGGTATPPVPGQIDGAIHTATMTDPPRGATHGVPMAIFDWSVAQLPQLFIHHQDDPCRATRYSSIVARRGAIPLISVQGAQEPRGDACQARTQHGFVGREKVVMQALHDWVVQRQVPTLIGEPDR